MNYSVWIMMMVMTILNPMTLMITHRTREEDTLNMGIIVKVC